MTNYKDSIYKKAAWIEISSVKTAGLNWCWEITFTNPFGYLTAKLENMARSYNEKYYRAYAPVIRLHVWGKLPFSHLKGMVHFRPLVKISTKFYY